MPLKLFQETTNSMTNLEEQYFMIFHLGKFWFRLEKLSPTYALSEGHAGSLTKALHPGVIPSQIVCPPELISNQWLSLKVA